MTKKWILAVVAAGCMVFASCKKDDHPSNEEVYHTQLSDRVEYDLFGNIKVATAITHSGVTIKDDNIVPGDPYNKRVINFNSGGWITKVENSYYNTNTESYVLQWKKEMTYDGQNRVTVEIYSSEYDDKGKSHYGYKNEYTFDDNNKTAIEIYSVTTDGTTYVEQDKYVYTLNKYNRIDENSSYQYFPATTKAFATEAASKWIVEKDDQGNPTLSYHAQYDKDGKITSVGEYTKMSYEYY